MLSKTDAEGVRAHNRRAVFEHLRRTRRSTRKAISAATGLSPSSAAAIVAGLIRDGYVTEIEDERRASDSRRPERRGRPERQLALCPRAASVAAIKIAVGEMSVRLADFTGTSLAECRRSVNISRFGLDDFVDHIAALMEDARALAGPGHTPVSRLVVAVQGKTDAARGRILWSPALTTRQIPLADALKTHLGMPVSVWNDCSLMPERFRWTGSPEASNFAILFIGFGVGMGLRIGGETFMGQRSAALEFGHINHTPGGALCRCGNRGCIEAYAGDYAIWRRAMDRPADEISERRVKDEEMHALAARARSGHGLARIAFEEAGLAIGYGLGRIFTLIDPLPIVFTGAATHAMDLFEPAIRRGIAESAIDGHGADTAFSIADDVDALVFDAAINHVLAELDEGYARTVALHTEAAQ